MRPSARDFLFSERRRDSGARVNPNYGGDAAALEVLERGNDERIQDLEHQVIELKNVSHLLRDEVQQSNSLLSSLGIDIAGVTDRVTSSIKRIGLLGSYKASRHIWCLAFFIVCVVVALYVLIWARTIITGGG